MKHSVICREEMLSATLELGGTPIDLGHYATTGLFAMAVGPRGKGKTNAGLVMAEQLAGQGWISVLVDPECELESLYGEAVASPKALEERLRLRDQPIVVVASKNAGEFIPFGRSIIKIADQERKPIFLMIDEGQLFSAPRSRKGDLGEAADIIKDFGEIGRKRALDVFITAHRFQGSLHRSNFANKNLTLIGCQEDPTAWPSLAPLFKTSKIEFADLSALGTGEFFCFSRHGLEKIKMPIAKALEPVALKAKPVMPLFPTTFSQWDKAMRGISTERLKALTDRVVNLLGAIAGVPPEQMLSGRRALKDEIETRL